MRREILAKVSLYTFEALVCSFANPINPAYNIEKEIRLFECGQTIAEVIDGYAENFANCIADHHDSLTPDFIEVLKYYLAHFEAYDLGVKVSKITNRVYLTIT